MFCSLIFGLVEVHEGTYQDGTDVATVVEKKVQGKNGTHRTVHFFRNLALQRGKGWLRLWAQKGFQFSFVDDQDIVFFCSTYFRFPGFFTSDKVIGRL